MGRRLNDIDNPFTLDPSDYPIAPVIWINVFLDTLFRTAGPYSVALSKNWRERLHIPIDSFLNHPTPALIDSFPEPLSYSEFLQQRHESSSFLKSAFEYAFETSSTSLSVLTTPTAWATLLVLVLLMNGLQAILLPGFRSIGARAGRQTYGPDWEGQNQARIVKFAEYCYRLLFHSAVSIYGVMYFYDKGWWRYGEGTLQLFRGFPHQEIPPASTWYYLIQAAYNVDAMLKLLKVSFQLRRKDTKSSFLLHYYSIDWSPTVRGDFREMFIHHLVTNLLIFGSSHCRLTRTGSMIFLIHDISDIPVDLSKLANFLKYKVTTVCCFLTMVAVWMVTRLYLLPFVIYRAILEQSHYVCEQGDLPPLLYLCYRHFFYVLVLFLIFLHLAWFGMFVQMFVTLVTRRETHDYSEHKHGEDQIPVVQPSQNGAMAGSNKKDT